MITLKDAKAEATKLRNAAWEKHREALLESADKEIRCALSGGHDTATVRCPILAVPQFVTALYAAGYRATTRAGSRSYDDEPGKPEQPKKWILVVEISGW